LHGQASLLYNPNVTVLAWLDSLPPSAGIWLSVVLSLVSAVIVAVVSRRSVMTQISNENSRFQRKLEHDAQEKATERAMQMKQEVLMPACEALASASQLLSVC
jgi:heme exporter protein D